MSTKILLHYFPKTAWVVLGSAVLLNLVAPEVGPIFSVVANGTLIYIFSKVSTVIHEYGHLACAHAVGGKPKRMILGIGHEVYRTEWRGVKMLFNSVPAGGLAIALFDEMSFMRLRFAFFAIGGVIFNFLAMFLGFLLFGFDLSFIVGTHGIDVPSAFILANAFGLSNLIPYYTSYFGPKVATDGLLLLQVLFGSYKKNFGNLKHSEEYLEAFEYFEKKDYDNAMRLYRQLHEQIEGESGAQLMIGTILLKQAQIQEGLAVLSTLEQRLGEKPLKKHKALILNNIAWAHLLDGNIEQAYEYISRAVKDQPRNRSITGTYGAVLIEAGQVDTGMKWLLFDVDLKHPNDSTLTTSAYMMLARHLKGESKESDKHRKFVLANLDKLEKDGRLVWERCLRRVEDAEAPTAGGSQ